LHHYTLTKLKTLAAASALTLLLAPALGAEHNDHDAAAGYEFVTIALPNGVMPGAFGSSGVGGINDRGWLVGAYVVSGSFFASHGFRDTGRTFATIDVPSTLGSPPDGLTGINNSGTIIGFFHGPTSAGIDSPNGFIHHGGKFTIIDLPGLSTVHAQSISNSGVIVGWAAAGGNTQPHGFVRNEEGQATRLDVSFSTYLTGVNDKGAIVGYYSPFYLGPVTSFLRQPDGAVSLIQVPGTLLTVVNAINDAGIVVGYYQTTTGTHGFVLDRGRFVTIDVPGASSTEVTGINNHGELAGVFTDAKGAHVFVGQPKDKDEAQR
jgi:hypothetical protein